jgi:hypothetical protein
MKTKAKQNAQQGDVLLRKITDMPQGDPRTVSKGRCVLAHGESGHSHVVEDDEAELIQIGERMLLKLEKSATVVHEEHKPITLSPGIWEVGRVQEYDYFKHIKRRVVD